MKKLFPCRYMFWTDYGAYPGVFRANMDGSDDEQIIYDDIVSPYGLAIDYVGKYINVMTIKWAQL